ncbi:hypothetical protein [Salinibacterium sp. ZJ77]|uniref:hypothetical protein n=1 Tax=Salinibacterium sp. ZJ77 TaxID=2708337 RepID=UPI00141F346B|nr:hypothetical protein [Salinibacterium sp. ZJ77]
MTIDDIDVEGMPGFIAQSTITDAIARVMIDAAPEGWRSLEFTIAKLAPVSHYQFWAETAAGRESRYPLDEPVVWAGQLRQLMYQEGHGTWNTMVLRVTAPSQVTTEFDYDAEPRWFDDTIDTIAYVTDQHRYPRDIEKQPEWLRSKLAEGWRRIHDAAPAERPRWVQERIDAGTHTLTPHGLFAH